MKPKNRIYCYGCQKSKMLFDTKERADNFIKFNRDGILEENGKAPVRSYYCEMCGGYHVTSNPSQEIGERLNSKEKKIVDKIESLKRESEAFSSYKRAMSERIRVAIDKMTVGSFDEIKRLYTDFQLDMPRLNRLPMRKRLRFMILYQNVNLLHKLSVDAVGFEERTEVEIDNCYSFENPSKIQKTINKIAKGLWLLYFVQKEIVYIKQLINDNQNEEAQVRLESLKREVRERKGNVNNNVICKCDSKIDRVERKLNNKAIEANETSELDDPTKGENAVISSFYKSTMLSIIEKIEKIEKAYNEGDFDSCESYLEIADYLFNELNTDDDNTRLLSKQLRFWSNRIK